MTDIEKIFKKFYIEHPELQLDQPQEKSAFSDVYAYVEQHSDHPITRILRNPLDEDVFITMDSDVALFHHLRYLPADYHTGNFFEIAYVMHGNCTEYIVNQEVPMKAGDLCIITPNTVHAISAFADDVEIINILIRISTFEKSFFNILSADDILSDFFTRTLYQSQEMPYLLFQTGYDPELRSYLCRLKEEVSHNHRYRKRMVNSVLSSFFILLLRNHDKDVIIPNLNDEGTRENLLFILRYMQENYTTVTLHYLAKFFNYSERQIQRIIKNATGLGFTENIQKIKMSRAADLLVNKSIPVTEISVIQGYSDVSNFRHMFKKYYGMTPSQYRRLHQS